MTHLNGLDRDRLYTPEYRGGVGALRRRGGRSAARGSAPTAPTWSTVMLDVDVQTYLVDDLLAKMDIATMASSLEARSPLLDHEFDGVRRVAAARATRSAAGQKKVALRGALRGWVPDEVLDAPKRGFPVPLAEWFRGELREFVARRAAGPGDRWAAATSTSAYVRELLDRHADAVEDHSQGIWTLLNFELWHREFGPTGG